MGRATPRRESLSRDAEIQPPRAIALDSLREGFVGDAFASQLTCPFCDGESEFVDRARNIHPERPIDFLLRRCSRCAHVWIDPLPSQPLLDHLYRFGSSSVIHAGFEAEPKRVFTVPERRVLAAERGTTPARYFELGVGKGLLLKQFQRMGWECAGVEPGDWGVGVPGVLRSLSELPAGQTFDLLVAMDVLEHVRDPIDVLQSLRSIAGPKARLYASFPNRQSFRFILQKGRWRMVRPLGHVHYFSQESATLMLKKAGFSLRRARTTDLVELKDLRRPRSLIFGAAQAAGWGDQLLVSAIPVR